MFRLAATLALLSTVLPSLAAARQVPASPIRTEEFTFEVEGQRLVGLFDRPVRPASGTTIVLVHGYGRTDVVAQGWHADLRAHFGRLGIHVLVWDKPGCGRSEGTFDIDQPVASSAKEVVAAVRALKAREPAACDQVGLWGISRAGWIAPLAMHDEPGIDFWISVSGTDDKENARYLLETNWGIEGHTPEEVERLVGEWQARFDAVWKGQSYERFVAAAPTLATDPLMEFLGWGGTASEAEFLAYQEQFTRGALTVDEASGLLVYVPGFAELLSSIDRPVLALFGAKDTNVDWRATSKLYASTLGENPEADLTVHVFEDANHSLKRCTTGGVREMRELPWNTPYAEGYFEQMRDWLVAFGYGRE